MIGLQTDYFLVLWEHWDDWSNEFVRWSYKKGYPRDRVINELLLSENWNTRETIFDPGRFLWEVYHGLVTDAIKVTGKELNRLAEQFFKGSAENISFLELLDKIACEYVLTYKQQGCGIFYQDEKNDVAVIHTFGIDLDFETFGGNSPDWAGVVTLLAFPARDLFKRCPIEENINLIYRYITDPENAHTENRMQGRLNGLRKRLKIAAEYEKLLEPNKAAGTSCQQVTDIQHERQQEAEPSKGEDVRAKKPKHIERGEATTTDEQNIKHMLKYIDETKGVQRDKISTIHFDKSNKTSGYKNYSDVANKSPLICYRRQNETEYKCGKDKNGKYWIKAEDCKTSPIWILRTPLK